jgi:hypothetical protein
MLVAALAWMALSNATLSRAADPLPSWNETTVKRAIVGFVEKVTLEGSPNVVPPAERIATFDNDGTLWTDQPMYFQLLFALDRIKKLAPQHPEWKGQEPLVSLLKGSTKPQPTAGSASISSRLECRLSNGKRIDR